MICHNKHHYVVVTMHVHTNSCMLGGSNVCALLHACSHLQENSEGPSSITNPKPRGGGPSQCLLIQAHVNPPTRVCTHIPTHTITCIHTRTHTRTLADGRVLKVVFATDEPSGTSSILPIFPVVAEEIKVRMKCVSQSCQ